MRRDPLSGPAPGRFVPALNAGKPERDLPLGRIGRVGPVHQIELRFQSEIPPDCAGCGLLHGVRASGELANRRDRSWSLHDRRHHRSRRDELQQRPEEWFTFSA
jgi:hypothetical protein